MYKQRDFLLDLFAKGVFSATRYSQLVVFLKQYYTQTVIGNGVFYVRNDKL
jgi:hypothetical protein